MSVEDRYVERIAAQRAAWNQLRAFIFGNQSYSLGDLVEYNVELIEEVDAAFDSQNRTSADDDFVTQVRAEAAEIYEKAYKSKPADVVFPKDKAYSANRYAGYKPVHTCETDHPEGYCDCACNNCFSVDPITTADARSAQEGK